MKKRHFIGFTLVELLVVIAIVVAYSCLFGSMAREGQTFLISGIPSVFVVYLEKKRRRLMKQIRSQSSEPAAPPPASGL